MGARVNLGSFVRFAGNRESGSDDRWDSFVAPVLFADPVAMEKFHRFRQARAVWTEATMQEELRSNSIVATSVDAATMHENQRYHLQGKKAAAGEFNFLQPTISAQPTNSAATTSARGGVLEEVGAANVVELWKLAERLRGEARGGGESSSSGRGFNFPISVRVYLFGRGPVFGPFGGAPRLSTAFDAVGAAPVGGLEPPILCFECFCQA
eukprot:g18970.t1